MVVEIDPNPAVCTRRRADSMWGRLDAVNQVFVATCNARGVKSGGIPVGPKTGGLEATTVTDFVGIRIGKDCGRRSVNQPVVGYYIGVPPLNEAALIDDRIHPYEFPFAPQTPRDAPRSRAQEYRLSIQCKRRIYAASHRECGYRT